MSASVGQNRCNRLTASSVGQKVNCFTISHVHRRSVHGSIPQYVCTRLKVVSYSIEGNLGGRGFERQQLRENMAVYLIV